MKALKFILFIFLICLTFYSFAQSDHKIDSLENVLDKTNGTRKVDILNLLADAYLNNSPAKSEEMAQQAIKLSGALKYDIGLGKAHQNLGKAFEMKGKYERAFAEDSTALEIFKKVNDQSGIADVINHIGVILDLQGNYIPALNAYTQCLEIKKTLNDQKGIASGYNNIGIVHDELGNYVKAMEFYLKSLTIREKLGNKYDIGGSYNNIGIVHEEQGNFDEALEYLSKALALYKESGSKVDVARAYDNMGEIYRKQEHYEKALQMTFVSLDIYEDLKNIYGLAQANEDIAAVYKNQEKYDQAIKYASTSLKYYQELGDKRGEAYLIQAIGEMHLLQSNHKQAFKYLNDGLKLAEEIQAMDIIKTSYKDLSQLYDQAGDYQKSLAYYHRYDSIKDNLLNESKTRQITEMQAKFDLDMKEQQISSQQQQINLLEQKRQTQKRLRIALILGVVMFFILSAFIFNRYQLKKRSEQQLQAKNLEIATKNQQIESMNKELEQKALRAQMDPHFIFNALNSIQHFITTNEKSSALKYLSRFSKLIRQTLENSINDKVPIAQEINLLRNYLDLEALQIGK